LAPTAKEAVMSVAALRLLGLIAWILTALGGLSLLGIWVGAGGVRQWRAGISRLRAPVVFTHFALAGLGLILWILYVGLHGLVWAWAALAVLVVVALLGLLMLSAWVASGGHRSTARPVLKEFTAGRAGGRAAGAMGTETAAEHRFPVLLVAGHGVLAVLTLLLVIVVVVLTL
jgi:hypothetical protein